MKRCPRSPPPPAPPPRQAPLRNSDRPPRPMHLAKGPPWATARPSAHDVCQPASRRHSPAWLILGGRACTCLCHAFACEATYGCMATLEMGCTCGSALLYISNAFQCAPVGAGWCGRISAGAHGSEGDSEGDLDGRRLAVCRQRVGDAQGCRGSPGPVHPLLSARASLARKHAPRMGARSTPPRRVRRRRNCAASIHPFVARRCWVLQSVAHSTYGTTWHLWYYMTPMVLHSTYGTT